MNKLFALLLMLSGMVVVACTTVPAAAPPATPADTKNVTIRVNHSGSNNVSDLPLTIAEEILTAQGYTIQPIVYDKIELVPAAIEQGELDIANGSYQLIWAALAKGAPAKTILQRNGNQFVIAARRELENCSALKGVPIAMGTARGLVPLMLEEYFKKACPDITPEMIVVSGSNNRMPALVSGAIQAAQLELDDMIRLEAKEPGRFYPIVAFGQEFPDYGVNGHYVSDAFAKEHPAAVRDFVRAMLEAHRRLQDPAVLQAAILKNTDLDQALATTAANTYLKEKMWDVNGGLTEQSVSNLLDFLIRAETLPEGTTLAQVADLSYLDTVLDEIGRK